MFQAQNTTPNATPSMAALTRSTVRKLSSGRVASTVVRRSGSVWLGELDLADEDITQLPKDQGGKSQKCDLRLDFLRRCEPEQVRGSAAVSALSAPLGAPLSFCSEGYTGPQRPS